MSNVEPKKILLLNPPDRFTLVGNNPEIIDEERGHNPSLGLLYLAAYLKKNNPEHKVKILDSQVEELTYAELKEVIKEDVPDIVGLPAMTFTIKDVIRTINLIKSINEDIVVVLGGPHVNLFPDETISIKGVDFVVLGEGEPAFLDLVNNISNFERLKEIGGLVFRENGHIVNTGTRPLIQDLDALPFPRRDLTPYKKYTSLLATSSVVTTMFTSRGCPYKCSFCDRPHLGNKFRYRSAENVVAEIEECIEMGIGEILIYDDTFTVNRQRVVDICNLIIKKNLRFTWDIRARVNTVDYDLLKLMKTAGCARIHYGVESGNPEILKILKKGITLDQVQTAFKLSKKVGISTLGYFMIGSPTETKETIMQTINFALNLDCDFAHFTITTPFPGTELYRDALKQGIIKEDVWKEFALNPLADFTPPIWNENFTTEELADLLKLAYKKFYTRPGYILQRLMAIKSMGELKRKIKAGLKVLKL